MSFSNIGSHIFRSTLIGVLLSSCAGAGRHVENTVAAESPSLQHGETKSMQIFLLFGQSNMEGVPKPESTDIEPHPRLHVLAFEAGCYGRAYNEWYLARPPLHRCFAGVGPGDSFGKAMAEAWPEATIGLVPAALSGVDIDLFRKGVISERRKEFQIPPDNERAGAYEMLLERAKVAQRSGTIRGILFHQGESDNGDPEWVEKVQGIVADLKADLGLGDDVPFVAGELPYDGCCAGHNELVQKLPGAIPNAHVVTARDLKVMDQYHFDLEGQREMGRRYAHIMLSVLDAPSSSDSETNQGEQP